MGQPTTKLGWALALASMGLRVFPLQAGKKDPLEGVSWKRLATTDRTQIEELWSNGDYNIGVATGDGWLGLDIDMKNGKDGLASARAMGIEPSGFVVETPSGGRHVYFTGPDVGNSAGRLGDGLDVRSAGGYLVGPGSVVEGKPYTVAQADPPNPAPAELVHRCLAPRERASDSTIPLVDLDLPAAVERATDWLRSYAAEVDADPAKDRGGYACALTLRDYGLSPETAKALMLERWNPWRSPPRSPDNITEKVDHAYTYGQNRPGIAAPELNLIGINIEPPPAPPPKEPSRWFRHGDEFSIDQSWLFYGVLPATGVAVLVAPSGAGKTFVAIEMGRAIATGKTFFGIEPDELGATLYVFAGTEGSGFPLRLAALQEAADLPMGGCFVGPLDNGEALQQLLVDLQTEARRMLAEFGVPVRCVVIETLAATALLKDENDNAEAGRAMSVLAQISRHMNCLVLTSHHPGKDGNEARGASAIPAAADYVLTIGRKGKDKVRSFEVTKARNAEERQLGSFTLNEVVLGEDRRGRKISSLTVSAGEAAAVQIAKAAAHTERFLQCVDFAIADAAKAEALESVNGEPAVEEDEVKAQFKDVVQITDRSNRLKAFNAAKDYAEQIGRIAIVVAQGRKLIVKKEKLNV